MVSLSSAWRARVRVYECDALGHVNNAVYLHYLEQATAEAWSTPGAPDWELRSLAMEYLAPARSGDELEVQSSADGFDGDARAAAYIIRRPVDDRDVVRARATWVQPASAVHVPWMPDWSAARSDLTGVLPLRLSPDGLDAHRYHWGHSVRAYELDGSGHANPVQLLRWVEEAKYEACAAVGWPLDRMLEADLMIVQIRHDSEFFLPLSSGERVQVVSRICDLRKLKGTWLHEVYRLPENGGGDGREREIVALDYSTGAFLNRAGRPHPAPEAMMNALLRGVPETMHERR
jgi:acyl-CoA thioester hydrolase